GDLEDGEVGIIRIDCTGRPARDWASLPFRSLYVLDQLGLSLGTERLLVEVLSPLREESVPEPRSEEAGVRRRVVRERHDPAVSHLLRELREVSIQIRELGLQVIAPDELLALVQEQRDALPVQAVERGEDHAEGQIVEVGDVNLVAL